ncbi:MAG: class I SAM-dependent methyltransferase [Thermotogota bacterium]
MEKVMDLVAEKWGEIGPNYWGYFGKKLVYNSNIKSGNNVLDIGTGRGASLKYASRKATNTGTVYGIDTSKNMISKTQKIIKQENLANTIVKKLNFKNIKKERFDVVLSGFCGYLFFPENNLNRIYELLNPLGQIGVSNWLEKTDGYIWEKIIKKFFPDTPEKEKKDLIEIYYNKFKETKFKNIDFFVLEKDFYYKDEEEWLLEYHYNAARYFIERIKKLGKYESFKKYSIDLIEEHKTDKGIKIKNSVLFSYAIK